MNYIGERRPLGICLFFSIVSVGLFNIYWAYTVTYEISAVLDDNRLNPIIEAIGSILTFGIYLVYWAYKYEKYIVQISKEQGVPCKDYGLLLAVLSVFLLFPVSMMIMQKQLNNIWESA
ncbi:MAG: DUF4234 domain-containing protein [Clostridia bacterium]|nr:DUF4234 domain-containing protein [Clostridia bacterium]